jgi:hypothetical protein
MRFLSVVTQITMFAVGIAIVFNFKRNAYGFAEDNILECPSCNPRPASRADFRHFYPLTLTTVDSGNFRNYPPLSYKTSLTQQRTNSNKFRRRKLYKAGDS